LTANQGSGGRGVDLAALRRRLGRIGVWFGALGPLPVAREREIVSQIESLGYPTLWITEFQKEAFAHAGLVLAATARLTVATGIANVWAREPDTLVAGAGTLADAYDGRFVLGVGIGHAKFVGRYEQPLSTMTNYLAGMHAAKYGGAAPESPVPWLIAALRPKMLELARTQTQGSHPYFVPRRSRARPSAQTWCSRRSWPSSSTPIPNPHAPPHVVTPSSTWVCPTT
jgi:probable F420-dependent oxidoreductase